MAVLLYSGPLAAGATSTVTAVKLPAVTKGVAVSVSSTYAATSATTGVQLQAASSIDGGLSFSDFAPVITTTPSGTISSEKVGEVTIAGADEVQFRLVNLDATNAATAVISYYLPI